MDRVFKLSQHSVWRLGWPSLLWVAIASIVMIAIPAQPAMGQRIRFAQSTPVPSSPFQNQIQPYAPGQPAFNQQFQNPVPLGQPFSSGAPVGSPMIPLGNNYSGPLLNPQFDPYAPTLRPSTVGVLPSTAPSWTNPWGGQPFGSTTPNAFPNNYPSSVYPNQTPPALFPGYGNNGSWGSQPSASNWGFGNAGNNFGMGGFGNTQNQFGTFGQPQYGFGNLGNGWFNNNPNGPLFGANPQQPMRFFMGPRFRHTWIQADDDPTSLETNDSDISLVFAVPNIFGSPLYIIPSFSFHTFEGPRLATAEIPANAYSGFIDVGWESDPMRTFGLELGVRAGVFSDFRTYTSDSFRVMGKALARVRLTPNATLRGGGYYIDRNRYEFVPAGGILWIPNPDTRFDIFFPEPKLSHYLSTIGTNDMWWYLTGYYGGGTWTLKRGSGEKDSIDINEVIVALGLEFGKNDMIRQGRRLGFVEGGFAFKRELLFKHRPQDNTDLEDGWVIRAGLGY